MPAAFPGRDLACAMALLPSQKLMVYVLKVSSQGLSESRQNLDA